MGRVTGHVRERRTGRSRRRAALASAVPG